MKRWLHGAFLTAATVWSLSPFLWQGVTSLKAPGQVALLPPLLPDRVSFENYAAVFRHEAFLRMMVNSLGIALGATALALVIGAPGAFGVSRLMGKGKSGVLMALLVVFMLPQVAVVTPFFKMLTAWHLKDTWWALIGVYTVFVVPLVVWVLVPVFDAVPVSLYHAARVDGSSLWTVFYKIYLPLARPGWISAGLLGFFFCWNEFLFALTFTLTDRARTVPVGISLFSGQYEFPWGEISAAGSLVSLPVLLLVVGAQRYLVRGLVAGSLKG